MTEVVAMPVWIIVLWIVVNLLGYLLLVWRVHKRDQRHYERSNILIGAIERAISATLSGEEEKRTAGKEVR